MSEEKNRHVILSIEAAIQGGSLSLFENDKEIDCWFGQADVSKAEDILEQIENLFKRNDLKKNSLKLITASAGAGSSTGLKIGVSLAKGLSKSLGCRFFHTPILEALLLKSDNNIYGPVVTAVPIGKDLICRQVFKDSFTPEDSESPKIHTAVEFFEQLAECNFVQAICHEAVIVLLQTKLNVLGNINIVNAGKNLAKIIGTQAITKLSRV